MSISLSGNVPGGSVSSLTPSLRPLLLLLILVLLLATWLPHPSPPLTSHLLSVGSGVITQTPNYKYNAINAQTVNDTMQSMLSSCKWHTLPCGCLPVKFQKESGVLLKTILTVTQGQTHWITVIYFLVFFLACCIIVPQNIVQRVRHSHKTHIPLCQKNNESARTCSDKVFSLFHLLFLSPFLIFYLFCCIYLFLSTCLQLKSGQINTYYCTERLRLEVNQLAGGFLHFFLSVD